MEEVTPTVPLCPLFPTSMNTSNCSTVAYTRLPAGGAQPPVCVSGTAHTPLHCPLFNYALQQFNKRGTLRDIRLRLKCDGTRAETRFRLSAKRTIPFKSAGASVQSTTTGSRGVRISGSNAGYMSGGRVKGTGYPLHSPVSPSLPLPCVTVCHHISTGLQPGIQSFSLYTGHQTCQGCPNYNL
jgi:hypothetical protein